jgi:hypothetical protein
MQNYLMQVLTALTLTVLRSGVVMTDTISVLSFRLRMLVSWETYVTSRGS